MEVNGQMPAAVGGSLDGVPTLVHQPASEFEELLERRRRLGQDRWNEERDGIGENPR